MNEQALIAQFQAGELKADRILFDEFYQKLCYFTERMVKDEEEGQKQAIDAFEKLFEKRTKFESLNNIKAFLYISCKNSCLNYIRSRDRSRKLQKEFIALQDDKFVEREYLEAKEIERIHAAVASLPDQRRRVIEMLYFEDKTFYEIAHTLGIAESTVRNHKFEAFKWLKEKLGSTHLLLLALAVYGGLLQYPFLIILF
ncbi:MAG: sigma-70 family RNA polymerase sigma factor [Chitinophagaceae bacterium]